MPLPRRPGSGRGQVGWHGRRSAPAIRHLAANTALTIAADGTPSTGFFWDGCAASLAHQAGLPLLNARFSSLKEALTFYVQRDTNPEKWYPRRADGTVDRLDELPAVWRTNVNTTEAPYNRRPGGTPALSDAEIDEATAFLYTLTDGWKP